MLVRNMATVHTLNSWRSVPVDAGPKERLRKRKKQRPDSTPVRRADLKKKADQILTGNWSPLCVGMACEFQPLKDTST